MTGRVGANGVGEAVELLGCHDHVADGLGLRGAGSADTGIGRCGRCPSANVMMALRTAY